MQGGRASNARGDRHVDVFHPQGTAARREEAGAHRTRPGRLPPEIAGAVNLLAHPLAGAAAFSALGFGLASHAFGVWMGAVSSAADMSERLFSLDGGPGSRSDARSFGRHGGSPFFSSHQHVHQPLDGGHALRCTVIRQEARSAEQRAASTARALIADAHSAARGPDNAAAKVSGDAPAWQACRRTARATRQRPPPRQAFSRRRSARPAAPDDLKAISGIGPKLEKVLNGPRHLDLFADRRLGKGGDRLDERAPVVQRPHRARRLDRPGENARGERGPALTFRTAWTNRSGRQDAARAAGF